MSPSGAVQLPKQSDRPVHRRAGAQPTETRPRAAHWLRLAFAAAAAMAAALAEVAVDCFGAAGLGAPVVTLDRSAAAVGAAAFAAVGAAFAGSLPAPGAAAAGAAAAAGSPAAGFAGAAAAGAAA